MPDKKRIAVFYESQQSGMDLVVVSVMGGGVRGCSGVGRGSGGWGYRTLEHSMMENRQQPQVSPDRISNSKYYSGKVTGYIKQ